MLEIDNISVFYGVAQALWDVSLHVKKGEIVALLGSNGSGKTTTLKTISGLLRPRKGSILINGERIDQIPPYKIPFKGVAHVPEGRSLFPGMTVVENLTIGAYIPQAWAGRSEALQRVFSLFPALKQRKHQLAATLSGGEQQMLAIGRSLMAQPTLLMLDEPSLGLAPMIVVHIFSIIQDINRHQVTILLVEQNANIALQVAHRGYVLETGKMNLTGQANELLNNEHVKKSYLGLSEDAE
ncbi:MAG: ABC transporter ATP-binding protein [Thermodesulfobacteriota bacterium]|jgi:branched-chain amino acid transport system ATP-binding protein